MLTQVSTWQSWLSNFGFGWDFSKQERVLALCLGASVVGMLAVNLGSVFCWHKVSPEPLYFSGPSKAHKQNKKKASNKQKPTVDFLNICIWGKTRLARGFAWMHLLLLRLVSPKLCSILFFLVILALSFFCFTLPGLLLPWTMFSSHHHFIDEEPSHTGYLEHFPGRMLLHCQDGHFFLLPPKQFGFNSLYLLWILKKWWIDLSINIYQEFTLFHSVMGV